MRDSADTFASKGVVILGVSQDSVESHKKWTEKIKLNYDLLADTDGALHKAYGFAGKARAFVLVDKTGAIAFLNRKYDLKEESWKDLLKAVEALK